MSPIKIEKQVANGGSSPNKSPAALDKKVLQLKTGNAATPKKGTPAKAAATSAKKSAQKTPLKKTSETPLKAQDALTPQGNLYLN